VMIDKLVDHLLNLQLPDGEMINCNSVRCFVCLSVP